MITLLEASADAQTLLIHWTDGGKTELSAQYLRQEAQDAWSKRARLDYGPIKAAGDLRITAMQQVGPNGINVHFSDGHDRAIYPFPYLRELSDRLDN